MDHGALVLIEIGALILGIGLLSRLAAWMGISPIPLILLGGLAFGDGGLIPFSAGEEFIEIGAEIGVILLLLMLGLEYTAQELVGNLKGSRTAGLIDMALNAAPGVLIALLLGWGPVAAVAMGGITWVSSSGVIAKVLQDLGRLTNRETPVVLSILVIEDFAMAFYLPVLTALLIGTSLIMGTVSVVIALLSVLLILYIALRHGKLVSRLVWSKEADVLLLTVLGLGLLVAGLAAGANVSSAVGAFLVGIAISGPAAKHAQRVLTPLRDLFAAVFFLFVGLSTDTSRTRPHAGACDSAGDRGHVHEASDRLSRRPTRGHRRGGSMACRLRSDAPRRVLDRHCRTGGGGGGHPLVGRTRDGVRADHDDRRPAPGPHPGLRSVQGCDRPDPGEPARTPGDVTVPHRGAAQVEVEPVEVYALRPGGGADPKEREASGSAAPLVLEDRVDPGVGPVALEPHVLAEVRLVPHPDTQAQGDGRVVARIEFGVDPVQPQVAEREVEQQCRRLTRVSLALESRVEQPADLSGLVLDARELEIHGADQLPGRVADRRLDEVLGLGEARGRGIPFQHFVHALGRPRFVEEVAAHVGVGLDRIERIEVGGAKQIKAHPRPFEGPEVPGECHLTILPAADRPAGDPGKAWAGC